MGAQRGRRVDRPAHGCCLAGGVFGSAFGGSQRPHAAVRDRAGWAVLRPVDHRQCHPRGLAVGLDRLLGTKAATGGGVATGALALGLDHCFGPVMLHRVEATVRPENAASRAVLAKVGFREEGLLRRYLEVDRAWRDHLLMAITVEEVYGSVASTLVRAGHASWP
ncbi:GNAT family N-acetyltransferase [Mycobacterium tuberculosis]|nr:GNAT family N-acetyltransferase [Mycobacterium tuberculosis]NKE41966.1 GNAT family N-acetyltransferase [Mycobacterium tuberculosis]